MLTSPKEILPFQIGLAIGKVWEDVISQLQPANLTIRQTDGLEARGQAAWADFLHIRQSLTQSILKKLGIGLRD